MKLPPFLGAIRILSTLEVFGEVLRAMWLKWVAHIRHGSVWTHDIVSMTEPVRLIDTTEVDIDVAVRLYRDPYVVLVLKRNSSLCGQLLMLLSACRLQFIEPGAESLGV